MAKTVVRMAIPIKDGTPKIDAETLIEMLRYAGVIRIAAKTDLTLAIDINPPYAEARGNETWADMNARRIQSFGYNAVAAPTAGG